MARQGALRASDADRDRTVERLRHAATEGRIAAEELDQRLTAALRARTYAELDATVADLPRASARRPGSVERRHGAAGWALSTVRAHPALLLFAIPVLAVTFAMVIAATVLWTVMMVIVLMIGGHRHGARPPWAYGPAMRRYRGAVRSTRYVSSGRQARGTRQPYGRRPGRRWA